MIENMIRIECDICGLCTFAKLEYNSVVLDESEKKSWLLINMNDYYAENPEHRIGARKVVLCARCQEKVKKAFPNLMPGAYEEPKGE